jgi:hypothetical protein
MTDVAALENQLNQLILEGRSLEAFEQFYGDDIVMQENTDPPVVGKERNRAREQAFFGALEDIGVTLLGSAVNERRRLLRVDLRTSVQGWPQGRVDRGLRPPLAAGKVVHERFYYNPNS